MTTQISSKLAVSTPLNSKASTSTKQPVHKKTAPDTAFGKTLNQLMGYHSASDKISEEELFAAAIGQQIKDQFGDDAFDEYKTALKIGMLDAAPGHSGPSAEYAARQAVRYMVLTNKITTDQSRSLRSAAFEVAQLDGNQKKLYDGNGGPDDKTKAVEKFSKVQDILEQRLAAIKNRSKGVNTSA